MRLIPWHVLCPRPALACAIAMALALDARAVARDPATGQPPPAGPDRTQDLRQDPTLTPQQAAVKSLAESIKAKKQDVGNAAMEVRAAQQAGDEAARHSALAKQQAAEAALAKLLLDFESVAAGEDVDAFQDAESKPFDLLDETVTALRPLIKQLKDATEGPREVERLESQIELFRRRRDIAERATQRLDLKLADPQFQPWNESLTTARAAWDIRRREWAAKLTVAEQQLAQRVGSQRPIVEQVAEATDTFVRTRGLNLVIGLAAAAAVLLAMGLIHGLVRKVRPAKRGSKMTVYSRFGTVAWRALTAVFAVVALLVAFYAVSDWVLLLLTLVFLAGLGWTSMRMAPQVFEQVRLMLNLGSVREGERLVMNGIPWRVERLRLYTYLINPKLTGGLLRLPIRDLIGLHSRPIGSDEVWFPTSRGDWVVMDNGVRAQVVVQSPDLVQLQLLGGAQVTCRTEDFVGMKACNLSSDFRINVTFGVDYAHQAICTTRIPAAMEAALRRELQAMVGADKLVNLRVEFKEAGASSLDYAVLVDLRGTVARDHDRVLRAISRILVDVCNEQSWVIPFTQVTLHQAAASA